jgi:flagellar M-ring protein FliF
MRGVTQSFRDITAQPAVMKSLPLLGFVALLGLAFFAWTMISAAPSRSLYPGLPEEQKASVVEALNGAGIDSAIDSSTGAITVSGDDFHRARMLLASQGLPRGGAQGNDVIADMPLGSSRAVETERIRGAREADLARTIEAIDSVATARVHLAVEQPSVFVRDRPNAAASVMLTLEPGRALGDNQVQAIVNLVASSVPGMTPDGVSVIDQNGQLLSRSGGAGATGETERQLAVQAQVEDRARQAINALLTPVVGAGNFTAEVHAEMDFAEVQSTREGFPENMRALSREEGQVSSEGGAAGASGPTAGGIPGALSNQPPAASEVANTPGGTMATGGAEAPGAAPATANAGRRTENYDRNFAVGREVSVTRQQTGTVKRLSVAVALRNPDSRARGVAEMRNLEELVKGAVGFDQTRGDVVAISSRQFAATETPVQSWYEASWVSMAVRNATALVVALLLIFGLGRPLLRKSQAALAKNAEAKRGQRTQIGGEIANVIADRARTDDQTRITLEMIESTRDYEARAALIRNFVRQDPARAALVVRDLIRADATNGADRNG